tara:strand:- start:730 stop:1497 length:768 start_codon:yes stop_codon:yes gene_type:complete
MKNLFNLENKNIIIVGGEGLIGKYLVKELNSIGGKIASLDINSNKDYKNIEKNIFNYSCDISKIESVKKVLVKINKDFSSIDILINAAQYKPKGFLTNNVRDFPLSLWQDIINVNLTGAFIACKVFGSEMIKNKKGSIINLASVYGIVSSNSSIYSNNSMGNPIAYTASKGGVIMLTKYLATHWANYGIRVNSLSPHGVSNNHEETFVKKFNELSPMGRMMDKDELLSAVVFLSLDESSYMTGQNLVIDGGWTSW